MDVWELYRKHKPDAKDLTATHLASFRLRTERGYTLEEILASVDYHCLDGYWSAQSTLTSILKPDGLERAKQRKPRKSQSGRFINSRGAMETHSDAADKDRLLGF